MLFETNLGSILERPRRPLDLRRPRNLSGSLHPLTLKLLVGKPFGIFFTALIYWVPGFSLPLYGTRLFWAKWIVKLNKHNSPLTPLCARELARIKALNGYLMLDEMSFLLISTVAY